jgi:hypothetical protein
MVCPNERIRGIGKRWDYPKDLTFTPGVSGRFSVAGAGVQTLMASAPEAGDFLDGE